jgi:hypothetical protein
MAEPQRTDEEFVRGLLEGLAEEECPTPEGLPERAIGKVRASITTRDLLDLSTAVFLLRFCAPILDLIAAMIGREPHDPGRNEDE